MDYQPASICPLRARCHSPNARAIARRQPATCDHSYAHGSGRVQNGDVDRIERPVSLSIDSKTWWSSSLFRSAPDARLDVRVPATTAHLPSTTATSQTKTCVNAKPTESQCDQSVSALRCSGNLHH